MIDTEREELITLREAAPLFPRLRGKKRPHISTLYRWTRQEARRGRPTLDSTKVGGTIVTSREAIHRFIAASEAATDFEIAPATASNGRSARQDRQTDDILKSAGIIL
ncbi:MAG: DUF1580 domain-containing protein [Planctomycetes bacterium]|nr:DUF1580 domain-containing protein [Planctomycetota bacterium]